MLIIFLILAMNRFAKEKYPVPVGYISFINSAVGKNKGKRFQDSEIFDRLLEMMVLAKILCVHRKHSYEKTIK